MELVTAYWRQDRLRGLELAALTAATDEGAPTEATLKRLTTFARYGARIDKDIAKALQALRALRNRPDDWLDAPQECTCEPEPATADPPPPAPPPAPPSTRTSPRARPNPSRTSTATSAGHSRRCSAAPPDRGAAHRLPLALAQLVGNTVRSIVFPGAGNGHGRRPRVAYRPGARGARDDIIRRSTQSLRTR